MQTFFEYAPWIVFGLVYKFAGGLYPATAALMICMALMLAYDRFATKTIPQLHLVLAILVWVFGAATLILHDVRFLQWKASVFYWIAGLIFGGSVWIGPKTLLERLMSKAVPEGAKVPAQRWRACSLVTGVFFLALGTANIWIALHRSESDWVTFKVWIAGPLVFVFTIVIFVWLFRDAFGEESPS
jgi:intracellular septation protein